MKTYKCIGIMSGTSLDGLDLAYCSFKSDESKWAYEILEAETIPYTPEWRNRLMQLIDADKESIEVADRELGLYIGSATQSFINQYGLEADFIASHGHTIFHDPTIRLTLQIGAGPAIANICNLPVVNDFRSKDVAMGGQGAPLVPIGDRLLFTDFKYCLNLGGIANISYEDGTQRIAFDICPANMVLNFLVEKTGKPYDDKGTMASQGNLINSLVDELESLPYYSLNGPRSLGREWITENIFPILKKYQKHPVNDLLASFTEHMALRISAIVNNNPEGLMLATGGGTYNEYLLDRIKHHCHIKVVIPKPAIIDFKEAMVFAFLGLLRMEGLNNVLGSVTGSGRDHCAGEISYPDQATSL